MKRKSFSMFFVKDTFKVGHLVEDTALSFNASQIQHGSDEHQAIRNSYRFRTAVSKMKASKFMKHYELEQSRAKLVFFGDYSTFKRYNPHVPSTKEEYLHYLESEDHVYELLLDLSVYLFKELPFLHDLQIDIPNHGRMYSLDVSRRQLDRQLNCRLSDMKDGHHHRYYFLYMDDELDRFVGEFVKVKRMRRRYQ
ncbi:hypothetical protein ACFQPF_05030 [Fictibacillus iocasae]|uniref:Uncharacterized protein n=1 Tax=Fictibacillus iocasae TaxID=2715437 RepID=A0ABW2NP49_9BACL